MMMPEGTPSNCPLRDHSQHRVESSHVTECNILLYEAVRVSMLSIDLDLVRHCVLSGGADPLYMPSDTHFTALHCCIINSHVDALEVLLQTPRDLDFTVTDTTTDPWTPLHSVVCRPGPVRSAMLTAIIRRLFTHPNDRASWGLTTLSGDDVLGIAIANDVLYDVYPLVKSHPYYKNAAKPIMLTRRPSDEDWERLSECDQHELHRPSHSG